MNIKHSVLYNPDQISGGFIQYRISDLASLISRLLPTGGGLAPPGMRLRESLTMLYNDFNLLPHTR